MLSGLTEHKKKNIYNK